MSKFQLLGQLQETRLIQNKSYLEKIDLQTVLDSAFLYLLALEILRASGNHEKFVKDYAYNTMKYGREFDKYRTSGNDLYTFLHLILDDSSKGELKNAEKSNHKLVKKLKPNQTAILYFIDGLKHERDIPQGKINRFFISLEKDLLITDSAIRSMRRLARDWDDDKSQNVRHQIAKKLVLIFKSKMRHSELLKELEKLAKSVNKTETKENTNYSSISSRMNEAGGTTNLVEPKVAEAFARLGDQQRGRPEMAMLKVQNSSAGGVVPFAVEHIGDLSHRMTHGMKNGYDGYDTVKPKVEKCLRVMTNPYGFTKEHEENIASNARYRQVEPEELDKAIDEALDVYSLEHNKLIAYNEAQQHAIMAAITFGTKDWNKTIHHLQKLQGMLTSQENWREEATKNMVDKYGDPIPYDHWPVTESKTETISYTDLGFDTFDVDREDMPQIRKNKDEEFLEYLGKEGIAFDLVDVPVASLKPTQAEYNPDRLSKPKNDDRPIIISQDEYVLDGHHRWTSSYIDDQNNYINVIRVYLNIGKLFDVVRDFDGAVFKGLHEGSQVTETLDNPYPFNWSLNNERNKTARFQTKHGHINVIFNDIGAKQWDISFYDEETLSDKATEMGDEFRIFSTVVATIRDWYKSFHPIDRPVEITFSASKDDNEKSRTTLYSRFIKQFAKETRMHPSVSNSSMGDETVFTLKRRKKPKRVPNLEEDNGAMTPEVRDEVLNSWWSAKIGLKAGAKARFWRGVNPNSGGGMATYGTGLYITGSRAHAKEFAEEGRVIEMDRYDLPQNPFWFRTINDYEIWVQRIWGLMGFDGPRAFNASPYGDVRKLVAAISPEVDGIQISTGKDALFVNYQGRKVFEDGRIVKGVNTTVDVGTDAVKKEASKWGWDVSEDGYPKETST